MTGQSDRKTIWGTRLPRGGDAGETLGSPRALSATVGADGTLTGVGS